MAQLLEFTQELCDQVECEISRILTDFEPVALVRPQIEISIPWNLRVSPAHASIQDIALATIDIALWVFTLDDYTPDEYDAFFEACLMTLAGGPNDPRWPVLGAFAIHRDCLISYGQPMARYVESRRNIADAYRRRNGLARSNQDIRFDEYLEWRRVLIGTRVWLSAWEVIGGFWLPEEVYSCPVIHDALESLIYGQILENEIHSLRRDLEAGTPSLVVMYSREHGLTLDESVTHLRGRFRENESVLRAAIAEAERHFDGDDRVAALLEMIELCLEGSASLYQLKLSRYQIPQES